MANAEIAEPTRGVGLGDTTRHDTILTRTAPIAARRIKRPKYA